MVVNVLDSKRESLTELGVFIMKCNITLALFLYSIFCFFPYRIPKKAVFKAPTAPSSVYNVYSSLVKTTT